jgi:Tfp pilus assembly protein PilX
MAKMMPTMKAEQQGLALVAVLWLVALLTALTTAAVIISAGRARVVRATAEDEQARVLADAAIRLTLVELASPQSTRSASDAPRNMEVLGVVADPTALGLGHDDRVVEAVDHSHAWSQVIYPTLERLSDNELQRFLWSGRLQFVVPEQNSASSARAHIEAEQIAAFVVCYRDNVARQPALEGSVVPK